MFASLDLELQILRRLSDHRRALPMFDGATDQAERCKRMRAAILEQGCDVVIFGVTPAGKPETYAAVFERLYHEPLHPKGKSK
jgi:excinuclease UvrABC helicase subunit UvrB